MGTPTRNRVGVLAVDDQPMFLDAAREVVAATTGFHWLGGATFGEEALDAMRTLAPALVLLDVRMPGVDGIEAAGSSGAAALVRKRGFGPAMRRRLWSTHSRREG